MVKAIYRFEVPRDDQPHRVQFEGDVFAVAARGVDTIEFWALGGGSEARVRTLMVVGTGQPLPEAYWCHWGTVVIYDVHYERRVVWHLIELLS